MTREQMNRTTNINRLYGLEKIMVPEDFMNQIPLWVVASLGKEVAITADFVGPCETYAAGCRGVLMSIDVYQTSERTGKPFAIVALDPNDFGYLENFEFDQIQPVARKVKFSLDIQNGVIAF